MNDSLGNGNTLRHIAIIMDGNGRWAKQRGLARAFGHRQGAKAIAPVVRRCKQLGVEVLTLYAFSTENWKRPADEVAGIMDLLRAHLREAEQYRNENVRLRVLGDRTALDGDLQRQITRVEEESAQNTALTLNIALNYGGREELLRAVRGVAQQVQAGVLRPEQITEQAFAAQLYTAGQPDPDLVIRPSGEQRLSNFLLWQCAYAELVFMDILWPDFTPNDLDAAIQQYAGRSRRFGGI